MPAQMAKNREDIFHSEGDYRQCPENTIHIFSKKDIGYAIVGPAIKLIVVYNTIPRNCNLPKNFSRRLIVKFNCSISNEDCFSSVEGKETAKSKPRPVICEGEETAKSSLQPLFTHTQTSVCEGEETAKSKPQFELSSVMSVHRIQWDSKWDSEGASPPIQYQ